MRKWIVANRVVTWASSQQCLSLVLPYGYPQSVTPDYATFQVWDTVQGLCSYLRSILCTCPCHYCPRPLLTCSRLHRTGQQSLFAGLGVGDASATASSAALSWMFLRSSLMPPPVVLSLMERLL